MSSKETLVGRVESLEGRATAVEIFAAMAAASLTDSSSNNRERIIFILENLARPERYPPDRVGAFLEAYIETLETIARQLRESP